jgi:Fe-S-cluster containining protein
MLRAYRAGGYHGGVAREWYEDGLRFECTLCGHCCSGPPGIVRFTDDEAAQMAAKLRITVQEFRSRYTRRVDGAPSLREVETEHGLDCVFLDRVTMPGKAICSLYEARPSQCRTFPWWPEHLRTPGAWKQLGKTCEGVGRGPVVPASEIRISAKRTNSRAPAGE